MNPYKSIVLRLNPDNEAYILNSYCATAQEFMELMKAEFPGINVSIAYDSASTYFNLTEDDDLYWEIVNWDDEMKCSDKL